MCIMLANIAELLITLSSCHTVLVWAGVGAILGDTMSAVVDDEEHEDSDSNK